MTYPTIRPELTLDFANSRQLDPRITFSRSSSATYLNPDTGLITLASEHEARFEKEGLLIEESNYNVLNRSTEPDNGYYDLSTGLAKIANNAVSPDGNQTALLLTEDSSTGLHTWGKSTNVSLSNNVMSLFVKSNGATKVGFRQGGESYPNTSFDLSTGTKVSGNGGIEAYPNDWYRIWQIRSGNGNKVLFHLLGDSNELSFQGDGTSGVWVWGFQKEPNKGRPTSLIVTEASTVTRAADVAQITGTDFSSWYNQTEGTVFVDFISTYEPGSNTGVASINNGGNSQRISLRPRNTIYGGSAVASLTVNETPPNVSDKIAWSFDTSGLSLISGSASDLYNSALASQTLTQLDIGMYENNPTSRINGTLSRLAYYSRRLTDLELETLTL